MEKINVLTNKYKYVTLETDLSLPYKYLPEIIKELKADVKQINKIITNEKNSEIVKASNALRTKLNSRLFFFEKKLSELPNINYIDESDEDYVDNYMQVTKE